ncbi:MAG TPA: AraC family transcriptional regulator [Candidatus Baltobacteraceae bacterium]|nr:AraC family transcriptional regulator [Candidatus Baltobacteraceae bacterium]
MEGSPYYGNLIRRRTAGPFIVTESAFHSGSALPAHCHEAPYFTFTLRGSYHERYGTGVRDCVAGSVVAHPAFEVHSQEFSRDPALLIRVEPLAAEVDCAVEAAFERPLFSTGTPIANAVLQMHCELERSDESTEMILEGLAFELTALALRSDCSTGGSRKRALCARAFIRSSLRDPISLGALSKEIGVSRTTLYRDFKSAFGCAPGDYLLQTRVAAAASLLRKTKRPISQIAAACGFFDQSHFDRSFRRMLRISPAEYRAKAG